MLCYKEHVLLPLLVFTVFTIGTNVTEDDDVLTVEETWKKYRNIIRGGFFFNESVIALADHSEVKEYMNDTRNKYAPELNDPNS